MRGTRTFTAALVALSITGYTSAQTVRCTTWNLEWFPNGSAKATPAAQQEQRIKEAADDAWQRDRNARAHGRFQGVVTFSSHPVALPAKRIP